MTQHQITWHDILWHHITCNDISSQHIKQMITGRHILRHYMNTHYINFKTTPFFDFDLRGGDALSSSVTSSESSSWASSLRFCLCERELSSLRFLDLGSGDSLLLSDPCSDSASSWAVPGITVRRRGYVMGWRKGMGWKKESGYG